MTEEEREHRFGEPATGWSAAFTKLDLLDLIQLITLSRRTLVVCAQLDGDSSVLAFRDGQLLHASCEGLTGDEAFLSVVRWERGIFEEVPTDPEAFAANVVLPTEELVMEAARRRDEAARPPEAEEPDEGEAELERAREAISEPLAERFLQGLERCRQVDGAWVVDGDGTLLAAGGSALPSETRRWALWASLRALLRTSSDGFRLVMEDAGRVLVVRRLSEQRCLLVTPAAETGLGVAMQEAGRLVEGLEKPGE